jgi:hypothetical protein
MEITLTLDPRALNLLRVACENVDMYRAWYRDLDAERMIGRRYDLAILADQLSGLERAVHVTDPDANVRFTWDVRIDADL